MNSYLNYRLPVSSRAIISVALLVIYVYTLFYAWEKTAAALSVSDWMINYSAGFVRRGLAGTIILMITHWLTLKPELIVFLIKAIFYGAMYCWLAVFVYKNYSLKIIDTLIILSPATFLFPLIDGLGSGRKEILLLAFLMLFSDSENRSLLFFLITTVFLTLLTAIHEGLFFFYPLFLLVLFRRANLRKQIQLIALSMVPSFLLMLYLVVYPTQIDDSFILKMIQGIDPVDPLYWDVGAISALKLSSMDGVNSVIAAFSYGSVFSLLFAVFIFIIPILLSSQNLLYTFGINHYHLVCALIFQLPIFIIATDWGRWFYIDATILTIAYLTDNYSVKNNNAKPFGFSSTIINITFIVLVVLNASTWRVVHCCDKVVIFQKIPRLLFGIE